ncbi:hypothetical protein FPV67DRAFT_1666315 [Lyophyllum atratum]|nr:hypothetical protein FPV67DRAFT_1666315 [Lyophyllum atratum]
MLTSQTFALCLLLLAKGVHSSPAGSATAHGARAAASPVSLALNGVTYVNKGLVGFGLIPHNFRETTGDTLGGIGSGIDIKFGTWRQASAGTFIGTFVVTPDRGFNVDGTIDQAPRTSRRYGEDDSIPLRVLMPYL